MTGYRHTQAGHVIYAAVLAAVVFSAVVMTVAGVPWLALLTTAIGIGVAVVFGSLTVMVDDKQLTLKFGPGPIGRRWRLAEIASVRVVRNPWFTGWGIRYLPGATVYNVSGFDAVEVTLKNGRRFRIGTDEPERLLAAIAGRLAPDAG